MRKNGGIFKNKVEEDIEMKIYHAQVNHLENPMGFRMERTVFSWKVKDAEGKKQSYARIRVASDAAMEHLLFDSGEDDKASSLFYPVKLDLEPRTRYYWNVEAGSDAGETAVSEVQFFETGKRNEAWTGKWISCDSKENRHPYFEKEIVPAKEVAKARLYVCGLGLYEVYVDEKRVGDEYLTPYSNDYNEWVQYQTYDVTEEVSKQGMLRVLLGNGWYKARFGFSAFEDKGFYGNEWKLIAELHLTYADGSEEVIGTDESWQVRRSKIAFVWGDAACIIPWNLYLFYGDKSILEDQFVSMKSWVDYITKVDGDNHGWRYVFHFGDWLALDNPVQGAEQVMGATDEEFIANLYYAISAGIVAKAAGVLGYREEQEKYQKLSEEQFAVVQEEYYSATGRCCIKTQTALLLTLKYHLSKNEELTKRQLLKLFEQSNHKLKTGFVGTPLLNNVLTDNGMNDLAYELLLNEEFPGWLYEVKLGATTVWERWNSLLADGTISGISMNSMNHYAYGSIQEWMFRHVAGINTMESHPGVRTVQFAPTLNWDLRYAEAKYDSASGMYSIRWELSDKEHVTITMDVPFDCTAEAILPMVAKSEKEAVAEVLGSEENGRYLLEPGHYEVSYQLSGWKEKTAVCVE